MSKILYKSSLQLQPAYLVTLNTFWMKLLQVVFKTRKHLRTLYKRLKCTDNCSEQPHLIKNNTQGISESLAQLLNCNKTLYTMISMMMMNQMALLITSMTDTLCLKIMLRFINQNQSQFKSKKCINLILSIQLTNKSNNKLYKSLSFKNQSHSL